MLKTPLETPTADNTFRKVARYKINMQNTVVAFYLVMRNTL